MKMKPLFLLFTALTTAGVYAQSAMFVVILLRASINLIRRCLEASQC